MDPHGNQLINGGSSAEGLEEFFGVNPTTGERLEPPVLEATQSEIDTAMALAVDAYWQLRDTAPSRRADLLDAIAAGIEGLGELLLERAELETALPQTRLQGERGRTCHQLRMFADVIREGSWGDARIDHGDPDRKPVPKPDVRRMLIPVGPVVVFGASNFPLAISVAGNDTVSAFAAGCPVVVKAHPNHPGTSELVGRVIQNAIGEMGLPAGMFSLIQGVTHGTGAALVQHPSAKAVGFTGSLRGGRAMFDLAAARPEPIPVYAEMGSINPVFMLPSALEGEGAAGVAAGLHKSLTTGVGQFCTNPGLVVALRGPDTSSFLSHLQSAVEESEPGTMLHAGIRFNYEEGLVRTRQVPGVEELVAGVPPSGGAEGDGRCQVRAALFTTSADVWLSNPTLSEEVFGPSTLVVQCEDLDEMLRVARNVNGQLTATVHGSTEDLRENQALLQCVEVTAGRVVINGYPTGVEICPSIQHGGPYPATTDARTTSMGSSAIQRFARLVCYQDLPDDLLPPALQEQNPGDLRRLVDGEWTR